MNGVVQFDRPIEIPTAIRVKGMSVKGELKKIRLDDILWTETGTQARAGVNSDVIDEYAEAMAEQESEGCWSFAPPVVFDAGNGKYYIGDGWHRLLALRKIGKLRADVMVFPGGRKYAVLYACGANASHGLRRSMADKIRAITLMATDPEWEDATVKAIGEACRVCRNLVAKVLKNLGVQKETQVTKSRNQDARRDIDTVRKDRAAKDVDYAEPDETPDESPKDTFTPPDPGKADDPPELPVENTKDGRGNLITSERMKAIFREVEKFDDAIKDCQTIGSFLNWAKGHESGRRIGLSARNDYVNLMTTIREAKPYTECPTCRGLEPSCAMCNGFGFLTKRDWEAYERKAEQIGGSL